MAARTATASNMSSSKRDVQNRVYNLTDPYNFSDPPDFKPSVTTIYDEPTGAVARRIRNVNPDSTDLTIYNLATDYTLDAQARAVITLGPWFNANGQQVRSAAFSAFLDAQREVRTAARLRHRSRRLELRIHARQPGLDHQAGLQRPPDRTNLRHPAAYSSRSA